MSSNGRGKRPQHPIPPASTRDLVLLGAHSPGDLYGKMREASEAVGSDLHPVQAPGGPRSAGWKTGRSEGLLKIRRQSRLLAVWGGAHPHAAFRWVLHGSNTCTRVGFLIPSPNQTGQEGYQRLRPGHPKNHLARRAIILSSPSPAFSSPAASSTVCCVTCIASRCRWSSDSSCAPVAYGRHGVHCCAWGPDRTGGATAEAISGVQ